MSSVARALLRNNVRAVFGIPGTHTVPIYRGLQALDGRISTVTTRHEAGAGYAADGYARATGKLAAVCVVTGIGLTNTLTPMAAALADSVPMLVISSEVPSFWASKPQRQYSHFVPRCGDVAAAVSKRSLLITSVTDIEAAVTEACALARGGRPGPVHLSIPIDVLAADNGGIATTDAINAAAAAVDLAESGQHVGPLSAESLASLQDAAAALRRAERPVIVVGGGARGASSSLTKLAEALDAPVLSTVAGKGALDERHPLAAGARLHHPPTRDALLAGADHVLLLGTQLSPTDYWQFQHAEEVPLPALAEGRATHVDIDARALAQGGVEAHGGRAVLADASDACHALLDAIGSGSSSSSGAATTTTAATTATTHAARAVAAAKAASDAPSALSQTLMWDFEDAAGGGQAMLQTLAGLRAALPDDTPLVSDVCRLGYTALSMYPAHRPSSFLYPVGTTALGYGLPAAVGACLGRRLHGGGGPVALLVGDGGLQMSVQELAVAAEERLPLLLVCWNDGSYGEIRRSLPDFATTVPRPDLARLCEAYGIEHVSAEDGASVEAALASPRVRALLGEGGGGEAVGGGGGGGGPILLEVNCAWDAEASATAPTMAAAEELQETTLAAEDDASTPLPPQPVLGTMTFGWDQASRVVDAPVAAGMLKSFAATGGVEVDTARMYAGGQTEVILADAIDMLPTEQRAPLRLATKANPAGDAGDDGTGGLSAHRLTEQLDASLAALRLTGGAEATPGGDGGNGGIDSKGGGGHVDTFYLHWPDNATPLDETLAAVQRQYERGRFARLGLSNYSAGEVQLIHETMARRGWVTPSVYQGMYNALARGAEAELMPLLRELGMDFYAFNPLAGGLLTGKHRLHDLGGETGGGGGSPGGGGGGRFDNNAFYQERYWKRELFSALDAVRSACEQYEAGTSGAPLPMAEAAIRWLSHHSMLRGTAHRHGCIGSGVGGDGVILGASSVAQLEANLRACQAGPLPPPVVAAWEEAWEAARESAPRYDGYGLSGSAVPKESAGTTTPATATTAATATSGGEDDGCCSAETAAGTEAAGSPRVREVRVSNGGAQLELAFCDGRKYKLHAGWLRDSSPNAFNASYVRRSARHVRGAARATVAAARPAADGSAVLVDFGEGTSNGGMGTTGAAGTAAAGEEAMELERFDAGWLHACAPYVGEALDQASPRRTVDGAGYLLEGLERRLWRAGHEVAQFDASEITRSDACAARLLETMAVDGVAVVHGCDAPSAFDLDAVGEPVRALAQRLVGKLYSHPRRRTAWGVMREQMATSRAKDHLADYNFAHPLSMHTDHAFIDDVPGYLQFMYQAQASVRTSVVDGVAVAVELRTSDPAAFQLLSSVPLTHSLRTVHYDANGDYCHLGSLHDGVFEDCHTHPILELGDGGVVRRVAHSEIKRGVCAIPYDVYHDIMGAYTTWLDILEDPRFVVPVEWPEHTCIVLNNHRVMHTRASPPADGRERIMVWAYAQKHITELRYRLLRQQMVERGGVSDVWTTRLPNQIVGEIAGVGK